MEAANLAGMVKSCTSQLNEWFVQGNFYMFFPIVGHARIIQGIIEKMNTF
jgi:hypothetical protein